MSQADLEALRRRYEAVNAGDRGALFRDADPAFTLKTPDRVPNAGIYFGAQEATRFIEDFWEPFEEVLVEPQEFLESGDRIVVLQRLRLRHRGSSAFLELRVAMLWTMRDGKPLRTEMYPEAGDALEAVGLSRQDDHASS